MRIDPQLMESVTYRKPLQIIGHIRNKICLGDPARQLLGAFDSFHYALPMRHHVRSIALELLSLQTNNFKGLRSLRDLRFLLLRRQRLPKKFRFQPTHSVTDDRLGLSKCLFEYLQTVKQPNNDALVDSVREIKVPD